MIISPVSYCFEKKLIVKQYQHGIFGKLSLGLKGRMDVRRTLCVLKVCLLLSFGFDGLQRYAVCQRCFMRSIIKQSLLIYKLEQTHRSSCIRSRQLNPTLCPFFAEFQLLAIGTTISLPHPPPNEKHVVHKSALRQVLKKWLMVCTHIGLF